MKLVDLMPLFGGYVKVTVKAYYEDGEYYSFMTYNDEPMKLEDIAHGNWMLYLPILGMFIHNDVLYIDVKDVIQRGDGNV